MITPCRRNLNQVVALFLFDKFSSSHRETAKLD